jgi:phage shock protein A
MTTQQQIASLHSATQRIEELAEQVKDALAKDDPAEAEVALAELAQTAAAISETLAGLAPEDEGSASEPPAD